jgi:hypothetical protein
MNDNARICSADPCTGDVSWNATTRTLILTNSATLTLTGGVYSLCKLQLRNTSQLRIAARAAPLRIYFDSPEACGGGNNWVSLNLQQNSSIVNANGDPTTLQVFIAGSPTKTSSIDMQQTGDPTQDMVMAIYAPLSTVNIVNTVHMKGSIVAKKIELQNNIVLTYDNRVTDITALNSPRLFQDAEWVECTVNATGAAPESGC